jgi:uncharacterized protein YydD (DUF2326 family)
MRLIKLTANDDGFHSVEFRAGFNLIVAERTHGSTAKATRNGAGKSTVIELLHFCLGRKGGKGDVPVLEDLAGWEFRLEVELFGAVVSLTRAVDDPKRIAVVGDADRWPIPPTWDEREALFFISATELTAVLAHELFGLGSEDAAEKYSPKLGSLLGYFSRRGNAGYSEPFKHNPNQQEWDKQVNVSFLLGLHWQDASAWQILKDEKKQLDQLEKAASSGMLKEMFGSEGGLETERVRLTGEIEQQQARLAAFRVHEDYRSIEIDANAMTEELHRLANASFSDRQAIELYTASSDDETAGGVTSEQITAVYEEAGLLFPQAVSQQLEDVAAFHDAVISNRREYLASEVARLETRLQARERRIAELDTKRAERVAVLQTHGALEEFQALQKLFGDQQAELADIEGRIRRLRDIAEAKRRYKENLRLLEAGAATRYEELRDQRDQAIRFFNEDTQALYETPGRLVIDLTATGFRFSVDIEKTRSTGVEHMKIFCFDLTLMQLWGQKTPSPGFLIHDSLLYDGVDERQKALALDLAAREAERLGWQYICFFNTDELPLALLSEGSPARTEPILALSDASEAGMLLGKRFG